MNVALFRKGESTVKGLCWQWVDYQYGVSYIFFLKTECKVFCLLTTRKVRIFIEFVETTLLKVIFAGLCNRAFSYTIPSSNVFSCLTLSFYAVCFYFRKTSCAMQIVYSGVFQQSKKPVSVSDFTIEAAVFLIVGFLYRNTKHHKQKFSNFNI